MKLLWKSEHAFRWYPLLKLPNEFIVKPFKLLYLVLRRILLYYIDCTLRVNKFDSVNVKTKNVCTGCWKQCLLPSKYMQIISNRPNRFNWRRRGVSGTFERQKLVDGLLQACSLSVTLPAARRLSGFVVQGSVGAFLLASLQPCSFE